MEETMMVCKDCAHEEMATPGAMCTVCGGEMMAKEGGVEMGDDAAADETMGDAMPAADKPMDDDQL